MVKAGGFMKAGVLAVALVLLSGAAAQAVPTLQVGVDGPPGTYGDYVGSLTNPTETDTALGSGSPFNIHVGGKYGNKTLLLGGQHTDSADGTVTPDIPAGTLGPNWSDFGFASVFDTKGAVVMVAAPDPAGPSSITVEGLLAFYTTSTFEQGFVVPTPPSDHDPIKDNHPPSDPIDLIYMFFDIGDFANNPGVVPDFADETGGADGEVKILEVEISGFEWAHFDALALMTTAGTGQLKTELVSNLMGNPGSHDITWKDDGGGGGGGDPIPEPGTIVLLGGGLLGLALYGRRSRGS